MNRDQLEQLLGQGLSLEAIGSKLGKHPSTVSYWLAKYGLEAVNHDRHAPRGGLDRAALAKLVEEGKSIRAIAETLGRSTATVRHWLKKYNLRTTAANRRRGARVARGQDEPIVQLSCPRHGVTDFWIEGRGSYRCLKCRQEAVVRRRRKVKAILIEEAGGACAICGYRQYAGALQFHHVDPTTKRFGISQLGVGRSLASAREEARKCVLLCANCHAEVESGVADIPLSFRSGDTGRMCPE